MKKSKSQPSGVGSQPDRFSLRKSLGLWELTFDGKHAVLKHEQGIYYVAYLLTNPPEEPIHALHLATRVATAHRHQTGLAEIPDPTTGHAVPLDHDARIQERSLGLDAAQTMRTVLRRENELEAILEDEDTIEPVREEVQRELIDLYRYEERNTARTRDSAQKCVRAVRMAIRRFHKHLAAAVDAQGRPHPVLRAFAAHLQQFLLVPSSRFAKPGRSDARLGLAGCLTYEPPGITWTS